MLLKRGSLTAGFGAAVLLLGVSAAQANAKDIFVGNNPSNCPQANYPTINAALAAASPGDQIKVCDGTYTEQVTITKSRIRLVALHEWKATIQDPVPVPAGTSRAVVYVDGARDDLVRGFVISGPFDTAASPVCGDQTNPDAGVKVNNGGKAWIDDNHITNIQTVGPFPACQNGYGVVVGSNPLRNGNAGPSNTPGSAVVTGNLIDRYQKNGVAVDGNGSYGDVERNAILGGGANNDIARNGIQISNGANADVGHNYVSGNSYTGTFEQSDSEPFLDAGASGISVFDVSDGVEIEHNTVTSNDFGIELGVGTSGVPAGTTSRVAVDHNSADRNRLDGIRAFNDAVSNVFAENSAFGNGAFDCRDDSVGTGTAGTANRWKNDRGATASPSGICRRSDDDH